MYDYRYVKAAKGEMVSQNPQHSTAKVWQSQGIQCKVRTDTGKVKANT